MRKATNLRLRATIVRRVREFLDARGYLAVETPPITATPIPESHIDLFETLHRFPDWSAPGTDRSRRLFLLPSPERHLKRLLAAGVGNVYEIGFSFRNGESIGAHHRPAFSMLEYYTVDADATDSLAITRDLLAAVGVAGSLRTVAMEEAWNDAVGVDLAATLSGEPDPAFPGPAAARRLEEALTEVGAAPEGAATAGWEELFQKTFLSRVEPALPTDRPLALTHYPAAIPTLARRLSGTPWADRWELYLGGIEAANCFGEETDPRRIAAFQRAEAARRDGEVAGDDRGLSTAGVTDGSSIPYDERFLQPPAVLPRSSGVALGIDRLVMHIAGVSDIGEVIAIDDFV